MCLGYHINILEVEKNYILPEITGSEFYNSKRDVPVLKP